MRTIIKITIILILLVNGAISYSQNDSIKKDVFDVKNEIGLILVDNPDIFVSPLLITVKSLEDYIIKDKKDFNYYNIGYIELSPEGPMIGRRRGVRIETRSIGDNERMRIDIRNLHSKNQCYYLKNLKFKDGDYELVFSLYYTKIKLKGSDIDVSDRTKNILFKNIKVNGEYKDIYFKDIEFTVIDFNDTENVYLLRR